MDLREPHRPKARRRRKNRHSDPSHFVYPPLDHSKSQFRLLRLAPGNPSDEITATVFTRELPALPRNCRHELHLFELASALEYLSTAISTDAGVQLEELARWAHMFSDLFEFYYSREFIERSAGDNLSQMIEMGFRSIERIKQRQSMSCNPDEVIAMHNLVDYLETTLLGQQAFGRRDYLAVSYCCGDQTVQEEITLNYVRVQVPTSAARALRGIRDQHWALTVWIDAICINPSDARERSHQVLLMSNIYSSASKTFVWLESEGDFADQLLSARFSDWTRHLTSHPGFMSDPKSFFDADSEVPETLRGAALGLFASLLTYLRQPWFGRLWVYQEVLLSQEVIFRVGQTMISWNYVRPTLEYYEHLSPEAEWRDSANISVLGKAAPWCRRSYAQSTESSDGRRAGLEYTPSSLTELLLDTIPFKCLDPRDKVYALLGLTSWSTQWKSLSTGLEPDYTLSVEDCMRNATLAAIREEMSLECLTLPVWSKLKPSWVVPWHELEVDRNRQFNQHIADHVERYSLTPDCSRGRKVSLEILRQPNKPDSLFLEGNRFSKILQVSKVIDPQDVKRFSFSEKLREVVRSVGDLPGLLDGRPLLGLSSLIMMALWWRVKVLSTDDEPDKPMGEAMMKDMPLWVRGKRVEDQDAVSKHTLPRRVEGDESSDPTPLYYLSRLMDHLCYELGSSHDGRKPPDLWSRDWEATFPAESALLDWSILNSRFYLATAERSSDASPTGHMLGHGPIDMQPGDVVVVLHGSKTPVVLRPEQSWWLLVGPAFSHTLRDMTFIFNSPSPESNTEIFEIG